MERPDGDPGARAGASLTRAEVRAFDRRAIEELGIPGAVLMENAGRAAAEEVLRLVRQEPAAGAPRSAARVVVLCGPGNNGGDGYVLARHLLIAAVPLELYSTVAAGELTGDAALNRRVFDALGLHVRSLCTSADLEREAPRWDGSRVLVDALLGTGFQGEVRAPLAGVIARANAARVAQRVAIDLPSGLDCDSGQPSNATFRADLTVTFVARKRGFDAPGASDWTGRVVVAGIGAPYPWPRPPLPG